MSETTINTLSCNNDGNMTHIGNWLDKLFEEDDESIKTINKNLLEKKEVSKYYIWPEMLDILKNRTAWVKIEDQWTHVKFQINGGKLQMLIL